MNICVGICGILVGGYIVGNRINKVACKYQTEKEKYRLLSEMMNKWLMIRQRGDNLGKYFQKKGIKTIAIYGLGEVGRIFAEEMIESDVDVLYGIDRNINAYDEIRILTLNEDLPNVDAIVVTPIASYEEIENDLSKKTSCPIVSLEDIVYEMK